MAMTEQPENPRVTLVRESLTFQLKLLIDGLRDFVLVPVALGATLIGLLRSGRDPEVEFQRVLELGRRSERWINLFGQHEPFAEAGDAGSIDRLVSRAEEVVREQVRRGDVTEGAGGAIERALDSLHQRVRELGQDKGGGTPGDSPRG